MTNEVLTDNKTTLAGIGVNAFLNKYTSAHAFFEELDAYLARVVKVPNTEPTASLSQMTVIEDSPTTLRHWRDVVHDASFNGFKSAKMFWEKVSDDRDFLNRQEFIVLDHFLEYDEVNGVEVARTLRPMYSGVILLCSNGTKDDYWTDDFDSLFDGVIEKIPATLSQLKARYNGK